MVLVILRLDVVGQAILRRVENGCVEVDGTPSPSSDIGPLESPVDMYMDDTFGAGRKDHAQQARDRVMRISEGVLAPGSAISTEKSKFASSANILGYQVDCISATIRPKDRAIDKLVFAFFLVSIAPTPPTATRFMAVPIISGQYVFPRDTGHAASRCSDYSNDLSRGKAPLIIESDRPHLPCSRSICGGLPLFFSSPIERVSPSRWISSCWGQCSGRRNGK